MPLGQYTARMIRSCLLRVAASATLLLLAACAGHAHIQQPQQGTYGRVSAADGAQIAPVAPAADSTPTAGSPVLPLQTPAQAHNAIAASPPTTDGSADTATPMGQDAPTQAEADYAALYGNTPYDPIADPNLPAPVQLPNTYDPWQPFNRKMHAFNNAVDRRIATPLARVYIAVVPRPVRLGVTNFFNNLSQPVSALNALLQGHPAQAGQSLARFGINTTIGLIGFFDPATTQFNIPNRSEDFGQTLGRWGWKRSRYLELPLLGPRTVRDVFGMAGDSPLSPLPHIQDNSVRVFVQGLQLVDIRTQLMAIDSMRVGAVDEYALYRDAWMQRRQYQIFGDDPKKTAQDDNLPDYLRDDSDIPLVPMDAIPVQ